VRQRRKKDKRSRSTVSDVTRDDGFLTPFTSRLIVAEGGRRGERLRVRGRPGKKSIIEATDGGREGFDGRPRVGRGLSRPNTEEE
jgi:hypothetical protein